MIKHFKNYEPKMKLVAFFMFLIVGLLCFANCRRISTKQKASRSSSIHMTTTVYGLDLQPKIDPFARPLIEDGIAVGFVIGIVKDGQTQVLAYGEKTKGSKVAPDADTVFEICSVSKVFTGILLSNMVQKGIVKLEDPVQEYLPAEVKMPIVGDMPITLEHLVTHTSGLPRDPDNFKPANPSNPYADYSESQMYEFLIGHKLRRPPGQLEYSNYGMALLGHLLAQKLGRTYEQCLVEHIYKPLGMQDTCITLNEDQRRRLASPYNSDLNLVSSMDVSPILAGAGGFRSTCNDMIKFIQANLKNDEKSFTQMLRMSHQKRHLMNTGMAMGLAWSIHPNGTLSHNGMSFGFFSWLGISPSRKVGVVVLSNTSSMHFYQFAEKVMRVALDQEIEAIKPRKVMDVSSEVLESYAGVYTLAPNLFLIITVKGDRLMVQVSGPNQTKYPFSAESKTKFFCKVKDAQISFVLDKDGKIDHLILHSGRLNQKAFPRRVIDVSSEVLESYAGVYTLFPNFDLTFTVEDGKLMVQATDQEKFQVFPESNTKFFFKKNDIQISFEQGQEGKIDHLILHQSGNDFKGVRKNEGLPK